MKKKNGAVSQNYLEKIPVRSAFITWSADEEGIVKLDIENKGLFNSAAQILLHKPKISHIHLDKIGSFVWPLLDGDKNIIELGKLVEEKFKEEANPLYERLAKYFQILESYQFIEWK